MKMAKKLWMFYVAIIVTGAAVVVDFIARSYYFAVFTAVLLGFYIGVIFIRTMQDPLLENYRKLTDNMLKQLNNIITTGIKGKRP